MSDCICAEINARNCPVHQGSEIDKLKVQNKIMRDALERIHGMSEAVLENATYITQETYASKIARQALKEVGEV